MVRSRRDLLRATGAVAGGLLTAGCVGGHETHLDWHYISVYNGDEQPHIFDITIRNGTDEVIFDQVYDLEANYADENQIIKGDPASVTVEIDDAVTKEFDWAPEEIPDGVLYPEGCSKNTSRSLRLELMGPEITDEIDGNDTAEGDDFRIIFDCSSVVTHDSWNPF